MSFFRNILSIAMAIGMVVTTAAFSAQENLILVAGDEVYQDAKPWVKFLEEKGVQVKHVSAAEFASQKQTAKFVVLMGSPEEGKGIGELVKSAVGVDEAKWLSQPGNKKMYVKASVWGMGQQVIVFAGSDRAAVENARKESREQWMSKIADWFDLEMDATKLPKY